MKDYDHKKIEAKGPEQILVTKLERASRLL